jgi:hypothetical protein
VEPARLLTPDDRLARVFAPEVLEDLREWIAANVDKSLAEVLAIEAESRVDLPVEAVAYEQA